MKTPRTDEAWNKAPTDDILFANAGWDFARQLETELNLALWNLALANRNYDEARRIEREGLLKNL